MGDFVTLVMKLDVLSRKGLLHEVAGQVKVAVGVDQVMQVERAKIPGVCIIPLSSVPIITWLIYSILLISS